MTFNWSVPEGAAFFNLSIFDSFTNELVQSFFVVAEPANSQQSYPISGLESQKNYLAQIFAISKSNVESKTALKRFNLNKESKASKFWIFFDPFFV